MTDFVRFDSPFRLIYHGWNEGEKWKNWMFGLSWYFYQYEKNNLFLLFFFRITFGDFSIGNFKVYVFSSKIDAASWILQPVLDSASSHFGRVAKPSLKNKKTNVFNFSEIMEVLLRMLVRLQTNSTFVHAVVNC